MKILLIDTKASNLHLHPSFKNHEVLTAIDNREAFQLLKTHRDIVLVISDAFLSIPPESRATQCHWLQFASVIAKTDRSFAHHGARLHMRRQRHETTSERTR